jgi:hypothetical protein
MLNPAYVIPRVARHFLPAGITRLLLRRGLVIRPGLETRAPEEAAQRYRDELAQAGIPLEGKRVLLFGYGGSFAVGCALLEMGAKHVTLCEKEAPTDDKRNLPLLARYPSYLTAEGEKVLPNPEVLDLQQGDIRVLAGLRTFQPVDLVLSTSVYEHLDDVPGITDALARVTCPDGAQLHYVDLRDHFFRYPFQMLFYSDHTWKRWLNPTSNHNRYRFGDYRAMFEKFFRKVNIEVLERDPAAFNAARARIRAEFLTGEEEVDAITLIKVLVQEPVRKQ